MYTFATAIISDNRTDAAQKVSRSLTVASAKSFGSSIWHDTLYWGAEFDTKAPLADGSEVDGRHEHDLAEAQV
jgi:hypothetical protein